MPRDHDGAARLAPDEFEASAAAGFLNTATYGLPPRATVEALQKAASDWAGRGSWTVWEEDGEICRQLFAELIGVEPHNVALLPAVSVAAGVIAMSLPVEPGDNVVIYEQDFNSTVLPWLALQNRGVEIRLRPLEGLVDAVDERTGLIALSAVQSADGAVADLGNLQRTGVRLFVDATQAAGAIQLDLTGADYVAAHGYKWLLCPRGLSFLYVDPDRLDEIVPWLAGWKARRDPYDESPYGPRELALDVRRLDVSLAWFEATGSRRSLELLRALGIERISEHNLGLARAFATELGIRETGSPIISVPSDNPPEAVQHLRSAGVACAGRAGSLRFCFHLYNDSEDVARALQGLQDLPVFAA